MKDLGVVFQWKGLVPRGLTTNEYVHTPEGRFGSVNMLNSVLQTRSQRLSEMLPSSPEPPNSHLGETAALATCISLQESFQLALIGQKWGRSPLTPVRNDQLHFHLPAAAANCGFLAVLTFSDRDFGEEQPSRKLQ